MARVLLENLTKIFRIPKQQEVCAVRQANLTVEDKEFLVLIGPSGCGKSTLLRLIAGLEVLEQGTITIDGQMMNGVAAKDRDIAMVFQNYSLFPHLTAYQNMAFGLKLRKLPPQEIEKRVRETAEMLGILELMGRLPKVLSGGERQRVALGRAIVRKPKLVLLDEPLSNLDANTRGLLRRELTRLHHQLGWTMIYVTHEQSEAMTMGHRIAVMSKGTIEQAGPPMRVYAQPCNRFVAGFLGTPNMNFFQGNLGQTGDGFVFKAAGKSFVSAVSIAPAQSGALSHYANGRVVLGIRPENFQAHSAGTAVNEATLEGVLTQIEQLGPESYLHIREGEEAWVWRAGPGPSGTVGSRIRLYCDTGHIHLFDVQSGRAILNPHNVPDGLG